MIKSHTVACIAILIMIVLFPVMGFAQNNFEEEESGEEVLERESFLRLRRAGGENKQIPADAYELALQQVPRLKKDRDVPNSITASGSWVNINPTGLFYQWTNANYISGRTNSIAFHPTDTTIFYIAAAGGGIWKTTNGGVDFEDRKSVV